MKPTQTLIVFHPLMSKTLAPFFEVPVPAGPGDSVEQGGPEWISIDEYIHRGREGGIIYMQACGDSMIEHGIYDRDLLVVARTDSAEIGDLVVAEVNGEFTIKQLEKRHHGLFLVPGNDAYKERQIKPTDSFAIWAVVETVIHRVRKAA